MLHTSITGTSFFAVTPGVTLSIKRLDIFLCPTPGMAISKTTKCPVPCARIVKSALILEWEDTLLPLSRLAARGPHLSWHGEEEQRKVGEAVELAEGEE